MFCTVFLFLFVSNDFIHQRWTDTLEGNEGEPIAHEQSKKNQHGKSHCKNDYENQKSYKLCHVQKFAAKLQVRG